MATINGKFSIMYKFCAYIFTTRSKWVVNQFFNLLFMKDKFEKHLSSSMLLKTITMDNSTNFNYSHKLKQIIWLVVNNAHILKHGLQSKRGFIVAIELANIITLKKEACVSNFNSSSKGGMCIWLAPMFFPWQ
jgi:hypothetical protein